MSAREDIDLSQIEIADSWEHSVTDALERSRRTAWIVATVAALIALLLAAALVILLPLKTVEPYTLLVDRQTGHVERLSPLDGQIIAPDAALTRSFLVQYVIARESFYADSVGNDYRKVALWSQGRERQQYVNLMQANNPLSPLSYMPRGGTIAVEVKSLSSLSAASALVRFDTIRTDPGAQPQAPEHWAAVVNYGFSDAEMSAADRLVNPLGFQVTRYRRDAEALPEPVTATPAAIPAVRANPARASQ
ncbi:virB8 family protein [Qipengyuania marisflavi]|uniref:Bacterial virulence protein VirB8 domain-containing protein n=1 Tax=Qipengyuania marisflavi TaxID=2486356 RepID=A0A5S3P1T0_9SPHN|nr:VirB8/TrbF family protein [Qipengyuania marisflavi]TMM46664.1 hypothetical protein FEV51_10525 [Qipengyuania marisflavi]